jgi:biotin operon repressor
MIQMESKIKTAFKAIKSEFDEHLACINENTQEIQSFNDHFSDIHSKLEKLNERIDELFLMFEKQIKQQASFLSSEEKQVFLALYATEKPVCYLDISKRTELSEAAVQYAIGNLIAKGVPILKRYINNRVFLVVESQFRELQAKLDVLNINQKQLAEFA